MFKVLSFVAALLSPVFCDENSYTIKYNSDNFNEEILNNNHFVMFYAPWCGHCQRLEPTWEQLAEMLNEYDSNIKIAKVDCTTDSKICADQDITGYPTLKFYKQGTSEGIKFRGTRDLPTITTFINEQLREDEESEDISNKVELIHGLIELTDENFHSHVSEGKHFVKFYAPWCGHCQQLAPVWENLAKSLEFDDTVNIAKIDCTQHKSICTEFEVKAYPTLLWIENGEKVEKYQGLKTLEELKNYVNRMNGVNKSDPIRDIPVEISSSVGDVTADNFKNTIQEGVTLVKYFAPWCGHCKRLAPTYEDLGKLFTDNAVVQIVQVDCTVDKNRKLCDDEHVHGFPTIYIYKNGKKVTEYKGSRTLEDLQDFVKKYAKGHDEL